MLLPFLPLLSLIPLAFASAPQIPFSPPTSTSAYHPTHIVQSVEVGGSLTRSTTIYTLANDRSKAGQWIFAVPGQEGFLEAWEGKTSAGKKELAVVKLGKAEGDLTYYSITPQSETVTIHRVISHFTTPKPKSLPQTAEFISMLWKADLLDVVAGLSPEELARVEELKVKVKTPTPRILDTSAPEGFVLSHANGATTVAFNLKGSLSGLEPQIATILYQQPEAVASFRKLNRIIEVSHWGSNLAVEDSIDLVNSGPELKGMFSRLDHQVATQQRRAAALAITNVKLVLPNAVSSPYFYDIVGNVSTSRFRPSAPPSTVKLARSSAQRQAGEASLLQLTPRYPLLGGWNYTFTVGYDAPLADYLKRRENGDYVLAVPFLTAVKDTAVDDATVSVRLPESARNIRVHTPFPVDSLSFPTAAPSIFAHTNPGYVKTYLDSTGRPTIVMKKVHCTDRNNGLVIIEYTASAWLDVLQKPTAIAVVLGSFFLVTILAKRVQWGFSN